MSQNANPVCLKDFEELAAKKLSNNAWDYYSSGSNNEVTLKESEDAFKRYIFLPKMMNNVSSSRKMRTNLLGKQVNCPIGISPTAMQRMAHPDGEIATAKAASKAGVCMILSTIATSSIEEVARAICSDSPKWFQLYIYKDRTVTQNLIERAQAEGFDALVLTVDAPIFGHRIADCRNKFTLPEHLKMANFTNIKHSAFSSGVNKCEGGSGINEYVTSLFDPSLSWSDIAWIKEITTLPIIVKGILTGHDAKLARQHGASAIIVSTHGGRQLDSVPASIEALSEVVKSVPDNFEVYLDGGVRSGIDVLKALCLGAKAVFIGRPVIWGLAYNGEEGVTQILNILMKELDVAMALLGVSSIEQLNKSFIMHRSKYEAKL